MLPIIISLWAWLGFILGFVTLSITQPASLTAAAADTSTSTSDASSASVQSSAQIDPELYDKAIMHAKTMSIPTDQNQHEKLLQQIQMGSIEALYTVAQSLDYRNVGDDRITAVQLWHALADGGAAHVPSAVALGYSYYEVDKEQALQYFLQASAGKQVGGEDADSGPHQASLFNAGRLFLELNDGASSLAYIRGCANVENEYPTYATPKMTETCIGAYDTLSDEIRKETITPPGIEDAAKMFLYANINEYPLPDTKDFGIYTRGMEYLGMYAEMVNEGQDIGGISGKKKGQTYLLAAQQELEQFQNVGENKMSVLQEYLLTIIMGRIQLLITGMEADDDEQDEL